MQEPTIGELYFKWLCSLVFPDEILRNEYSNVLFLLHSTPFRFVMNLDSNRLKDGVDMRYHFSNACKIPYEIISSYFDGSNCSMLEMMAGLAKRCDNDIMFDNYYGDRTSDWFSMMFRNLGLDNYRNSTWNTNSEYIVRNILTRFMERDYNPDGSNGGLFLCHNPVYDMRNIQIWDQMCLCMNEILSN